MIKINQLVKVYGSGETRVEALRGVDLTINTGEFVAIMGPSGSGKSTLMNIIGCLDKATNGDYILDNVHVKDHDDNGLAGIRNEKIGFVFQSFNLIPRMSALHNVELPMIYAGVSHSKRMAKAKEVLERVGLGDRLGHEPSQLSGGQKQRVAIARALVNDPVILLADEPTGNLDSKSTEDILDLFEELNQEGKTIIMVTHEPDVAAKCKRNVVVRDGQIIEDKEVR